MRTALARLASLLMLGVAAGDASLQARPSQAAQPVDEEIATAAVELDGAILFRVRGTSSYPAEARAQASILDVFNEFGVQIMTPAYRSDPAAPKVVPPKDWFLAPASGDAKSAAAGVPTQSPS